MENTKRLSPGTIGMAALGALALLLYGWFLSVDLKDLTGPGDAVVGQAMEALTALLLLWVVLLVLVAMDRAMGGPSWTRRAGYLLVPIAGIANSFATDYPHNRLCQISVLVLPLLAGAYVLTGRLPARGAVWAQALALVPMAALSAYAIQLFMS